MADPLRRFIYRLASGYVRGVTQSDDLRGQGFDPAEFGVTDADPPAPDWDFNQDRPAMLFEAGAVRLATQQEVDAEVATEAQRQNLKARLLAEALIDNPQPTPKAIKTALLLLLDEINVLRAWITDFKTDVALATSLTDLKARVALNPDLPQRTAAQAKAAFRAKVQSGEAD